jgi:hypothetical protein
MEIEIHRDWDWVKINGKWFRFVSRITDDSIDIYVDDKIMYSLNIKVFNPSNCDVINIG